ncbi:MAG: helix-turn-helix transcriptional regulator, partial [Coriobacteriales bacterium]
ILVFPDKKLQELLIPLDDDAPENRTTLADQRAAWECACEELAHEAGLTGREAEVMAVLANGGTAQQVADALVISVHTARAHIRNIHSKLGIKSNKEIRPMVDSRIGK